MKYKALAILAALTLAATQAQAGPGGMFIPGGLGGPEMKVERLANFLDLDDAQYATVQNIVDAAKPEIDALREQLKANRQAIEQLDPNDPNYAATLNNIAMSNGELATSGTLLMVRVRTDVRAVLTDEQRAKLERGKKRMRKKFAKRANRG